MDKHDQAYVKRLEERAAFLTQRVAKLEKRCQRLEQVATFEVYDDESDEEFDRRVNKGGGYPDASAY